jgi:hypothetical protein
MNNEWPSALYDLFLNAREFIRAHTYTVTLATGFVDYFTDFDMDVVYGGVNYRSDGLKFEGVHRIIQVGTKTQEQKIKIGCTPTDTLAGSLFLASLTQGLLDGATIEQDIVAWPVVTGDTWRDTAGVAPLVGPYNRLRVGKIDKIGYDHVELTLVDWLKLWDIQMPHRYYQPTCQWKLYSSFTDPNTGLADGCTMVASNFSTTGTVDATLSATAPAVIPVVDGITVDYYNGTVISNGGISEDQRPTYAQGKILFTSGQLTGQQFRIVNNDDTNLYLARPLELQPMPGDTFTMTAGCYKDVPACGVKFGTGASDNTYEAATGIENVSGNLANFTGYRWVPSESIGI